MNYCIVVSTDYGFLQEVENSLRLVLDPWKLLEAISYQHGEELLTELPIQMVLVDEKSMPTSPISFYKSTLERYPNTWFINVGTGKYPGVMQLELPFGTQTLGFFIQNQRSGNTYTHIPEQQEAWANIYPILLSHFWTGLLNQWVLPERTMIMMAARRMRISNLENMQIRPILMKTIHQENTHVSHAQATHDHLFFQELLTQTILPDEYAGVALDRFEQKWAVILYHDMFPMGTEELASRCEKAVEVAKAHNWRTSFYIGHPCLPEELVKQWELLEQQSEDDAGFLSKIVQIECHAQRNIAQIPDMNPWRHLFEQGLFQEVQSGVSNHILHLAQEDRLDAQWLRRFREDFLLEIYHATQVHGIPADVIITEELSSDAFTRAASSTHQLLSWMHALLDNLTAYLSVERPDTVVKKAQKYILQNLDQNLARDSIAEKVFVSSGYLGRIFKKELHVNISEYIYNERMKLAAKLLEQTDLYVTSIALNVGFSNFPYFSTQFKKYSGHTPVEYRKQYRDHTGENCVKQ